MLKRFWLTMALLLPVSGFALPPEFEAKVADDGALVLEWEDLVPEAFRVEKLLEELGINDMADDDPRAYEALERLKEIWASAPTRAELEGQVIRLPGFVIPLEGDGKKMSSFLLVPYFGACIHVPPPPANQMVLVEMKNDGAAIRELYDTVWVTGHLRTERTQSEMGEAGYLIEATEVKPYE